MRRYTYTVQAGSDGKRRSRRNPIPFDQYRDHLFDKRIIVQRSHDTPCWEWTASRHKRGYGYLKIGGKNWRTHRLMWFLDKGQIPEGMEVCHKCDNPPCFNPDHLFLGTHLQNMLDASSKKRLHTPSGTDHWNAKFTRQDILEIRRLYETGEYTQKEIAALYFVRQGTIGYITTRQTWRHI